MIEVHGHDGATEIRWVGGVPDDSRLPDRDSPADLDPLDSLDSLGTAWERHDDPHWPPADPNLPPGFPTP